MPRKHIVVFLPKTFQEGLILTGLPDLHIIFSAIDFFGHSVYGEAPSNLTQGKVFDCESTGHIGWIEPKSFR
jgi:hypothetical protein